MGKPTKVTNAIRTLRFTHGEMTQAELADRIGVTRQTIIAIEQGRYSPSLEMAFRIALAFGVPSTRCSSTRRMLARRRESGRLKPHPPDRNPGLRDSGEVEGRARSIRGSHARQTKQPVAGTRPAPSTEDPCESRCLFQVRTTRGGSSRGR